MEIVMNLVQRDCVEGYSSQWFHCTRGILLHNSINSYVFADTLRQSINKG